MSEIYWYLVIHKGEPYICRPGAVRKLRDDDDSVRLAWCERGGGVVCADGEADFVQAIRDIEEGR